MDKHKTDPGLWPKVRVQYYDPERKQDILTREEARERFGLSEENFSWLDEFGVAACSPGGGETHDVHIFHRYTLEDSIRDAAPYFLKSILCNCPLGSPSHR